MGFHGYILRTMAVKLLTVFMMLRWFWYLLQLRGFLCSPDSRSGSN